ncbi:hypothetical protein Htur_0493 [Haloterrigena turkmenica DSM 5511]|uniref:Uncharacterized protein n=1 Tax=Haloterrigena turkmenica (strain ATCC 51198 / DSM 5511 / JCM 9101 / NCIMB 13204 / VKM B-1734 / 4k) TaxID=543526 RepID=D2RVM7_HALTV|nr:hypothetical protein [Haloterrigena turkmenica]ADB59391.1 hypothetical protein Htur_0493 [Haloterrigena turkmenica DSM 5511]
MSDARRQSAEPAVITGEPRERADLTVIEPTVTRENVDSTGRVGAVAYPFRVYDAVATIERPLLSNRDVEYVVSVDRSRRLAVRADVFPDTIGKTVDDVLVVPSELPDALVREKAEDAVFTWTLRKVAVGSAPEISFEQSVDAHKLFWIASRPDGDVIVDSVRGTESPLTD